MIIKRGKWSAYLLYIVLSAGFVVQVREQVTKFCQGRTSKRKRRDLSVGLRLPSIAFCLDFPYKEEVLTGMGCRRNSSLR